MTLNGFYRNSSIKKESKNYQHQKLNVAGIHEKVRLQRFNLNHKRTHHLICENPSDHVCSRRFSD